MRDLEDDDVVVVESADPLRDIGGFGERLDVYSLYGLYSISPVDLSIADPVLVEAERMPVTGSQRRFSICIGLIALLVRISSQHMPSDFTKAQLRKHCSPPKLLCIDFAVVD